MSFPPWTARPRAPRRTGRAHASRDHHGPIPWRSSWRTAVTTSPTHSVSSVRPATLPGDRCEGSGVSRPRPGDEPTAAVGQRVAALLPDTGRVRTTGEHHDGGGGSASSPEGSMVSATVSNSSTSTSTPWSATVFNPHGLGGIDSIFAVAVQESDGRWLRCWSASAHGLDHPPRHR